MQLLFRLDSNAIVSLSLSIYHFLRATQLLELQRESQVGRLEGQVRRWWRASRRSRQQVEKLTTDPLNNRLMLLVCGPPESPITEYLHTIIFIPSKLLILTFPFPHLHLFLSHLPHPVKCHPS